MRLVEKKCPNCKASLKFNDGDTVITCEYCGSTYHIEKDEKKSAKVDEEHFADAFRFVNEVGMPIMKNFTKMQTISMIVPFIIFFVIAGFIGFAAYNQMGGNEKYVTELSQIDDVSMETFHDTTLESLQHYDGSSVLGDYEIIQKWESVGVYLLVSKDKKENLMYDVCKQTYKNKKTGEETELFAAVKYDDLTLTSNNVVENDYFAWPEVPSYAFEGSSFNGAYGYESVEKLYNKLIRSQSGEYKIEASKGLYIED